MWKIAQFGLTYGQDFGSWAAKLGRGVPINYAEFSGKMFGRLWLIFIQMWSLFQNILL